MGVDIASVLSRQTSDVVQAVLLDGGHLLFMTIEVLKGRPLSEKTMSIMTRAGMALLLLLIAFVFYNDIIRVIVPWLQRMFST